MKKTSRYSIFRLLRFLGILYVGIFLFGWFSADSMAFFPPPPSYEGDAPGLFFVEHANGEKVAVLELAHPDPMGTVLFAHGNAEDIGEARGFLEAYRDLGVTVYALDYRGYGLSDGRPSLGDAKEDVRKVVEFLIAEKGVEVESLFLHGRSLGTAFVLPVAAKKNVAGIILESCMLNGFRTIHPGLLYPLDPIPNGRTIRRISSPILMLHGQADNVIPLWHGEALLRRASEPKTGVWIPNYGHNDLSFAGDPYWENLRRFLEKNGSTDVEPFRFRC